MINKKIIVSLGDPAGIGPEIFLKAISKINSKKIFEKILSKNYEDWYFTNDYHYGNIIYSNYMDFILN